MPLIKPAVSRKFRQQQAREAKEAREAAREETVKTYSLELGFRDDRKSELPHRPVAEIYVKTYSSRAEEDPPIITSECVTRWELDNEIDRIKEELEDIRKKAHRKFAAEEKTIQERSATAKARTDEQR